MATALFAAGCFWGVEAFFERLNGVVTTRVGYSGGHVENPSYELVKTGTTGHAETTKIEFDPDIISYQQLVDVFFECHDPTSINRQGEDVGSQYRSIIFYGDEEQKEIAEQKLQEWSNKGIFKRPIVTEITESAPFYDAEEYHQKYLQKNGSVSCGVV
ncbi:peptide-methionine (S)-S-oxide reductase MsrA [Pontibacillus yanchengensis]|uniref:Peptide-methionine (S)-S-oxide reductase MsrA n=2 Tax=Pontibacillus yanchengensis TaxID=462910 RepID=A0ACC7VIC7_9BACI|nr:peptide-methionine (S)-S-oxide reductase MsrA [Pontibacillus yanchengensis]MYL34909.1 peptide-methionine (S)-S-oxide reductase MsrA [Pontibacillus yanchengensis]MYL54716.1 peptide-methionine (S)-S-oxide reductase MsrA [Pontibacillus yanchengensis]